MLVSWKPFKSLPDQSASFHTRPCAFQNQRQRNHTVIQRISVSTHPRVVVVVVVVVAAFVFGVVADVVYCLLTAISVVIVSVYVRLKVPAFV